MTRPRLLDLFCGAGGAGVGYHRAGFEVVGVDIEPHRDYPFPLIVADVLDILRAPSFLDTFDLIHASPPCPRFSAITPARARDNHPDLLAPTRDGLVAWAGRYVIENVPRAPMVNPVQLCGSSFGLQVRRHRLFESNQPLMARECQHRGQAVGVYGHSGDAGNTYIRPRDGTNRGVKARNAEHAQEVLGIDWMTRWADLADAIPPAYTQHIGTQVIDHLAA